MVYGCSAISIFGLKVGHESMAEGLSVRMRNHVPGIVYYVVDPRPSRLNVLPVIRTYLVLDAADCKGWTQLVMVRRRRSSGRNSRADVEKEADISRACHTPRFQSSWDRSPHHDASNFYLAIDINLTLSATTQRPTRPRLTSRTVAVVLG